MRKREREYIKSYSLGKYLSKKKLKKVKEWLNCKSIGNYFNIKLKTVY